MLSKPALPFQLNNKDEYLPVNSQFGVLLGPYYISKHLDKMSVSVARTLKA